MSDPKAFGGSWGVLNTAMAITTVAYVTIAFFGFLKFGFSVEVIYHIRI